MDECPNNTDFLYYVQLSIRSTDRGSFTSPLSMTVEGGERVWSDGQSLPGPVLGPTLLTKSWSRFPTTVPENR